MTGGNGGKSNDRTAGGHGAIVEIPIVGLPVTSARPDLLSLQRYEGHSALRCCTSLPWRNMFTPTRTAGTAQTIQPAL